MVLATQDYLARMGRWSASTRVGYGVAVNTFATCFQAGSADSLVAKIKGGQLDHDETVEKYITTLAANGLAPKTIVVKLSPH